MTILLSTSSLAGIARTLVAVGTARLAVMLLTVRAAAPRSLLTSVPWGGLGGEGRAGLGGEGRAGLAGEGRAGLGGEDGAGAGGGAAGCPGSPAGSCDSEDTADIVRRPSSEDENR